MLELINAIPENIVWGMFGYATAWLNIMGWQLGRCLYLMWKERRKDYEEE